MSNTRTERIDTAVSSAAELIGFLHDAGPINSAQAKLIIEAAVRASVVNAEPWEIRASAERIFEDTQLRLPLDGGQHGTNQSR